MIVRLAQGKDDRSVLPAVGSGRDEASDAGSGRDEASGADEAFGEGGIFARVGSGMDDNPLDGKGTVRFFAEYDVRHPRFAVDLADFDEAAE